MQPVTASPRESLTEAQVVYLLRDAPAIEVTCGAELIDRNLQVVNDISDDLAGGTISRNSFATIHGTASLAISRDLAWPSAIIRPHMTISDGTTSARFNLGAYFTSAPSQDFERTPRTYQVTGYDMLHGLYSSTGEAYAVDAGVSYLAAVEDILIQQGYTRYLIDQTRADAVLPSARVWPLDDQTRWLAIVNDLLGAIGYQGIWSDWDGQLRCQPYQLHRERAPEWLYDAGQKTSMLGLNRVAERDYFDAPNRWVVVRQNNIDDTPPVEGNGIYSWQNDFEGDTSTAARDGRVITKVVFVDAADHAALERLAQVTIDADMRIPTTLKLSTSPNPLHWHFDWLVLDDPDIGHGDVLSTSWTLPLDGADMTHEWTLL